MAGGSYHNISSGGTMDIKEWVGNGGTLVTTRGALNWATSKGLLNARKVEQPKATAEKPRRAYAKASRDRGGNVVGGAIFEVDLDLTHPLTFGYYNDSLPVFRRGTDYYEITNNVYATPASYRADPLLAGYINKMNLSQLGGSASIIVGGYGSGRVIGFVDNPAFRAFWWGTQKLIANATFFGAAISSRTVESAPPAQKNEKD